MHDAPPFADSAAEAEWQRQQRALRVWRSGPPSAEVIANEPYAALMPVLAAAPKPMLPADFGARLEAQLQAPPRPWIEGGLCLLVAALLGLGPWALQRYGAMPAWPAPEGEAAALLLWLGGSLLVAAAWPRRLIRLQVRTPT